MSNELQLNRNAAQELAEEKGFDPENVLFCVECGRAIVRTQKAGNPGFKDSLYCTCEDYGPPFTPLVDGDDDE